MGRALLIVILLAPFTAAAGNAEFEARETERAVRAEGTGTPTSERAIDRARSTYRKDPARGRAELDEVRRDARQRPATPEPGTGYQTPILDPAWREGR